MDTSGAVTLIMPNGYSSRWTWPDLDAFTQGYVETLFASAITVGEDARTYNSVLQLSFSDLAPEALAAILEDCAAFGLAVGKDPSHNPGLGQRFWESRQGRFSSLWSLHQAEFAAAFPPLAPYLGDDGRVYLRAAA